MEILISVGSVVLSLFLTVLSVKLAAGWLGAGRTGWGNCIVALLLAYVAAAAVAVGTGIVAALLPEPVNLVAGLVGIVLAVVVPILVFARMLETSGVRAFLIMLIATVVNAAILFGIVFVVATVLGVGLAGLGAMMGGMPGMGGGDEALQRFERGVDELCACTDDTCRSEAGAAVLDDLMAAMQSAMMDGNSDQQTRFTALTDRMEQCEQGADSMPEPPAAPPPPPAPALQPEPVPPPAPVPAPVSEPGNSLAPSSPPVALPTAGGMAAVAAGVYTYRDVPVGDAASVAGKLVRVTLADGSWHRDQLVSVQAGSMTLKRGKSAGGARYTIAVADIVRMQVFDR